MRGHFALAIACLMAGACGSEASPVNNDGPLSIAADQFERESTVVDRQIASGILRIDDDCVSLETPTGSYGLVWFADDVRWNAASNEVIVRQGLNGEAALSDGTRIDLGGHQHALGYVLTHNDLLRPDGC